MNYNPKCLIQKNCNPEGHLPVSRLLKVNVSIVFFLFLFIWSVLIVPAAAHGTYMSSSLGGIDVKAWYTGGEPMADTPYEVYTLRYDDNGNEIAELYLTGTTDQNGHFSFRPKEGVSVYRAKVTAGEHVAAKVIDLSSAGGQSEETYEPSLLTIIGGLGWIAGIFGLLMFVLSRKQKPSSSDRAYFHEKSDPASIRLLRDGCSSAGADAQNGVFLPSHHFRVDRSVSGRCRTGDHFRNASYMHRPFLTDKDCQNTGRTDVPYPRHGRLPAVFGKRRSDPDDRFPESDRIVSFIQSAHLFKIGSLSDPVLCLLRHDAVQ